MKPTATPRAMIHRRPTLRPVLAASIAALCFGITTHHAAAQTIAWGAATTMSADADVLTTGALDRAYIFNGTSTINGVSFTNFSGSGDTDGFTSGGFHGGYNPNSGPVHPNYDNLSAAYKVIANNGRYSNDGDGSITLNSLNTGLDYTVQIWVNDSRDFVLLLYLFKRSYNISIQFLVFSAVNLFHIFAFRVLLNLSMTADLCSPCVEYLIISFSFNQESMSLL